MRQTTKTISLGMAMFLCFTSCTVKTYTSASSIQPVVQAPATLHKKGDINISASYDTYNSRDHSLGYYGSTWYANLKTRGASLSLDAAATDNLAIGIDYNYSRSLAAYSHSIRPSMTYFKNFSLRKNNRVGIDVTGGFSYQTGVNFLSVDSLFLDGWAFDTDGDGYYDDIFYEFNISPQGYYLIDQTDIKAYVQPSFTYENNYFEWQVGFAAGYHYRLQYDATFSVDYNSSNGSPPETNPLVYYQQNRHFAFGEYFTSIGVGPDYLRYVMTVGGGHRNDIIQPSYLFFQVGLKGKF